MGDRFRLVEMLTIRTQQTQPTQQTKESDSLNFLGIDIGSLSCDAVLINDRQGVLAAAVVPTGARNIAAVQRARREVLHSAGCAEESIGGVVSTGYGRNRVADRLAAVTEITCHARGIHHLLPGIDVLIDIGGQDSKAMRLDRDGRVRDFAMNDKCAAGTGRFLEVMARALETDVDRLAALDDGSDHLRLSSTCTVFAESEVVSLIAEGADTGSIVSALHRAVAARTLALVKRVCPHAGSFKVCMSGGVAHNRAVVKALGRLLACGIRVPPQPDTVGALGAALIAREKYHASTR